MLFSLKQFSNSTAFLTESRDWSYATLFAVSEQIASTIGRRSLIFLLCENMPSSIIGYVSCMNHGMVPVMVDAGLDGELLSRLVEIYRPNYLWLPKTHRQNFSTCKELFSFGSYVLLDRGEDAPYTLHEELALLMTTSGSTGSPKLVRLSYGNIRSNTESIIEYLGIDENERSITNLPMHYVYGLSIINTHLYVGASLVVTEKTLFQKEFWKLFNEKKVTNFGGVPYTFEMLNRLRFFRMDFPYLRMITQAGGKLDPEIHKKFAEYANQQGKKFVVMYGAAEATARMGYLPPADSLRKCGSMGIAIPDGRFELVNEDGTFIDTSDMTGELVYHGPNVMMGYAECGEDLSKGDEMNGTLRTGDLAHRDNDGFYTIIGRKKRFLKMFGKRVNLEEVEHILRRHFQFSDIACNGMDDKLYVFLTSKSLAKEIPAYLSAKLGVHPSALSVKCLGEIPKNVSGKTLYRELEQYYDI